MRFGEPTPLFGEKNKALLGDRIGSLLSGPSPAFRLRM